ncbi:hypothetical protein HYH02_009344 [Chlamydomonas schloesseri]|uniref:Uncharacterized protein n=1 Tax=Chlamydomonas schloesseri TaxID=2026947 RepID=A0A835TDS8_9CHLO|nr:hypothetical protein HYH02_009344 [Chlamydomonas schloesseri]|eukprot:KAG2443273.1 hypothetical protein HYH02_009344 [Chlamydomonas schloesseri]
MAGVARAAAGAKGGPRWRGAHACRGAANGGSGEPTRAVPHPDDAGAFVHANMFLLLWIWRSALRREVTRPGVWFTYILCALGADMYGRGFTLPALLAAPYIPAAAGSAGAAGPAVLTKLLPGWVLAGAGEQLAGASGAGRGNGLGLGLGAGGSRLGGFVSALKAPAMSWLWGVAAGALIEVILLARLPVPPE